MRLSALEHTAVAAVVDRHGRELVLEELAVLAMDLETFVAVVASVPVAVDVDVVSRGPLA